MNTEIQPKTKKKMPRALVVQHINSYQLYSKISTRNLLRVSPILHWKTKIVDTVVELRNSRKNTTCNSRLIFLLNFIFQYAFHTVITRYQITRLKTQIVARFLRFR